MAETDYSLDAVVQRITGRMADKLQEQQSENEAAIHEATAKARLECETHRRASVAYRQALVQALVIIQQSLGQLHAVEKQANEARLAPQREEKQAEKKAGGGKRPWTTKYWADVRAGRIPNPMKNRKKKMRKK